MHQRRKTTCYLILQKVFSRGTKFIVISLSTFRGRDCFRLQTALKLCQVNMCYLQTKFNTTIGRKRVFEAVYIKQK